MLPDPTEVTGPVGTLQLIPTPGEPLGGQATHPAVIYAPETPGGYPYWMAMTPYPGSDDSKEDPCILASLDGINWLVPDGLTNPIDDQPGSPNAYNSDPDLRFYDGTFFLFWRTYDSSGAAAGSEEKIYYSTSIDGRTWSAKTLVYSSDHNVRRLLSPCLVLENGIWVMWAVDITPVPNQVVRVEGSANPAGPWSVPEGVDIGSMPEGREAWHLGVTPVEDGYVALLNDRLIGGASGELLMMVSADGRTWENSGRTVIPREQVGQHTALYRAVLLPDTDGILTGWRVWYGAFRTEGSAIWNIYRTFISTPYVPDIPDALPTPSNRQAEPVPSVTWYAYDLQTLRRISHVKGITGDISRALGAYETATLSIPTPLSGPLANRLVTSEVTAPNTLLVAEINRLPVWSGIVWKTIESSEGGYELGCATPESYLDRRYTRTLTFPQVEQVDIMAALAAKAADSVGIPLKFDLEPTGIKRDRTYYDDEDATLYQRISELSQVERGPEWTIRSSYADEWGSQLELIFTCKARIGAPKSAPRGPITSKGAAKARWKLTNDWSKGAGANSVIAYSSAQGSKRPQSVELTDILPSHPKIEHRFSPSSSTKEVTTLNDNAAERLTQMSRGTQSLEITARWDQAPVRLAIDLDCGDWTTLGPLYGPTRPAGFTALKRMLGYKLRLSAGTFSPTFWEDLTEDAE